MSVFLVVVVLAIGVSTMNNFDKMNAVQESVEALSQVVGQPRVEAEQTKAQETEEIVDAEETEETEFTGTMPEVSTIQEQMNEDNYYIVEEGDTLESISLEMYGTTGRVEAICSTNGLEDGNLIFIGQKLLLP